MIAVVHRASIVRLATCALLVPFGGLAAQEQAAEVRQIVTFLFQPNRAAEAQTIYEQQLKPIYAAIPALQRFRAYHEAESPEPLDLVVVSSYAGMAGMDSANASLRRATWNGGPAVALYGVLSGISISHHDQFVEMLPALGDRAITAGGLTVFEYVRVVPGTQGAFEALLRSQVRPFEQEAGLYQWSETGRLLVSDGWDYLRVINIRSLGAWQSYRRRLREAPFADAWQRVIAAQKTLILRDDERLAIR